MISFRLRPSLLLTYFGTTQRQFYSFDMNQTIKLIVSEFINSRAFLFVWLVLSLIYSRTTWRGHLYSDKNTRNPGKQSDNKQFDKKISTLLDCGGLVSGYKNLRDSGEKYHKEGTSDSCSYGGHSSSKHVQLIGFVVIFCKLEQCWINCMLITTRT